MATALSAKALSNLVCESSVRSSESVLFQELERNLDDLLLGTLARTHKSEKDSTSSKKKTGKLSNFLKELGELLNVPEDQAKLILTSYLAGRYKTIFGINSTKATCAPLIETENIIILLNFLSRRF